MKTHLIMPMGGAGSRFFKDGYVVPKPLIEIEGKPFFFWAARSVQKYVELKDITFVALKEHIESYGLGDLIRKYFPEAHIIVIPQVTPGPVFTCLEGLKEISDDFPLLFNDCDHMFKCSGLNNLLIADDVIDGALVTFESNLPHFSYVKYDENKRIVGTVEKQVVSSHAICGAYYFGSAKLFKNISAEYLLNCPYKESFLSGMYNVMCDKGMTVQDYLLDFHVEFGTPEEYKMAKGSKFFEELN